MDKFTPLPWHIFDFDMDFIGVTSEGEDAADVAHCRCGRYGFNSNRSRDEDLANAALIVTAVNNHSKLVGMLEIGAKFSDHWDHKNFIEWCAEARSLLLSLKEKEA